MTPREDQFCIGNALDMLSGTKAAIAAGYSEKTARKQACKLQRKPYIRARIAELRAKVEADAIMEKGDALKRLSAIARGGEDDKRKIRPTDSIQAIAQLAKLQGWDQGPPPDPDHDAKMIDDFVAQARAATGLPPKHAPPTPREGSTP